VLPEASLSRVVGVEGVDEKNDGANANQKCNKERHGLRSLIRLLVQDGQVLDDNECAEPNESRQADREQNPDNFNLLGVELKHARCSSTRQQRLRPVVQRDIAMGKRLPGAEWWAAPRLNFVEDESLPYSDSSKVL
jgi:hypothetical protein